MSAKESSGGHENVRCRQGGGCSDPAARLVRVERKTAENLTIARRGALEEGRPEVHRHPALPVAMEGSAAEAVGRPVGETVKGEDVLRQQFAIEDDVEHEMHGGTAEV